jgi:pimeloyl-ACP methyl ester carboxylesterase
MTGRTISQFLATALLCGALAAVPSPARAAGRTLAGVACTNPSAQLPDQGTAVEPKSGRHFYLDYPCDLEPGEPVVFILSLHGAGASGNWHRRYFPAFDYVGKFRLVVATPTAAGSGSITSGQRSVRMWIPNNDDEYLHDLVDFVVREIGRPNIKAFWLAGHSQGGMTSNRIVCTDYFKDKVDGWLSLSGGRIGPAAIAPDFFGPSGRPPAPSDPNAPRPGFGAMPACDISYIFESGELEITGLPTTSPIAERYQCGPRVRHADIVDETKGYVTGATPGRPASWGREARPGTAQVYEYPGCKGGRIVADVLRLDKGHTEGLEPKVTRALLQMVTSAPGGKIRSGR